MEKPNDDIIIACELKFIEMLDPAICVYLQLIEELNLYDIEWSDWFLSHLTREILPSKYLEEQLCSRDSLDSTAMDTEQAMTSYSGKFSRCVCMHLFYENVGLTLNTLSDKPRI